MNSRRGVELAAVAASIATALVVAVMGAGVAWGATRDISGGTAGGQRGRPPDLSTDAADARDAFARLPLTFVPNAGQSDDRVRYSSQGSGYGFFFTPADVVLAFTGAGDGGQAGTNGQSLALTFLGSDPDVVVDGRDGQAGTVNYLLGADPSRWHTGLPTFGKVTYRELWPGVEMGFRGDASTLKYELRVAPGADVDAVRLAYRGAEGLAMGEDGSLRITTERGVLTDSAPVTYQEIDGRRVPVQSRFVLHGADQFGFETGSYDDRYPLIVDPGLAYSTFLGGTLGDDAFDLTVDAAGNAYVTGPTGSTDFPTTPGAYDTTYNGGQADAFVTKLNPTGSALVYSTYLGGAGVDAGFEVVVDPNGNAYVAGQTESGDFPTTAGAYDTSFNGGFRDAFVAKLNAAGSALGYSTYLGGSNNDGGGSLVLDGTGAAYVTGDTASPDFPTTAGAFDTTFNSTPPLFDAFVTKLNAAGSALGYSTFLGGALEDNGAGIALEGTGAAYVAGRTRSADFPTTAGAYDTTANGNDDVFVTKLDAAGSALGYSTYLGGTADDAASFVALDGAGAAYVPGGTFSADFPTTGGAYDTTFNGGFVDAFVTKLNAAGSGLTYSTYLGGTGLDSARHIALDPAGRAHITGQTTSTDYPTTAAAHDTTYNGGAQFGDAIVTKLDATGSALGYSTFLGGAGDDEGKSVDVDATGKIYVTGSTTSANFPTTTGAYDTTLGGTQDAFVTKLDPSPAADTVALSPPAAVNTVGTSHTVTATATAGGQPVGNLTILFTVQGATNASGSCTTDASGQCTFTYQGPNLPGADLIRGCADNNANATVDTGEPCGQATKAWIVPVATPGQATGGGQIFNLGATDLIAFGFTAKSDNGAVKGECTLVDPSTSTKIKCTDATVLAIVGNTATFFGNATVNGTSTSYRIDATDNGEPGAGQDTFTIQTASGYTASGTLQHGNIQIRS